MFSLAMISQTKKNRLRLFLDRKSTGGNDIRLFVALFHIHGLPLPSHTLNAIGFLAIVLPVPIPVDQHVSSLHSFVLQTSLVYH